MAFGLSNSVASNAAFGSPQSRLSGINFGDSFGGFDGELLNAPTTPGAGSLGSINQPQDDEFGGDFFNTSSITNALRDNSVSSVGVGSTFDNVLNGVRNRIIDADNLLVSTGLQEQMNSILTLQPIPEEQIPYLVGALKEYIESNANGAADRNYVDLAALSLQRLMVDYGSLEAAEALPVVMNLLSKDEPVYKKIEFGLKNIFVDGQDFPFRGTLLGSNGELVGFPVARDIQAAHLTQRFAQSSAFNLAPDKAAAFLSQTPAQPAPSPLLGI